MGLLAGLIPVVAWAWVTLQDKLIERTPATGTVVEIIERPGGAQQPNQYMAMVELADGGRVRLRLTPPLPVTGATVPLVVEHYVSGKRWVALDRDRWLMGDAP